MKTSLEYIEFCSIYSFVLDSKLVVLFLQADLREEVMFRRNFICYYYYYSKRQSLKPIQSVYMLFIYRWIM